MKEEVLAEKIKKIKKIITILIPFFYVFCLDCIFKYLHFNQIYLYGRTFFLELIISYSIFYILTFLLKDTYKSSIIVSIIVVVIFCINEIKIAYTNEPVFLSDIYFLSNITDFIGLVSLKINIIYLLLGIVVTIVFAGVAIVAYKFNQKIEKNPKTIILFIVCLLVIFLLVIPNNTLKELYMKVFYNSDERMDYLREITNIQYYFRYGVIGGLYGNMLENRLSEPEGYDEKELEQILSSVTVEDTENFGTPNIILIFSEAFWDISQVEELEFDVSITENFNKLKSEGIFVNMISPTYGGLSSNVEYELLTGFSNRYFNKGYIPFMQLYMTKKSENYNSLVKELVKNNYTTEIVYGKDYYDSEDVSYKIGFQKYTEEELTDYNKKGYFISDEYLIDCLIERLENKDDTEKMFYMIETIQNHMEYFPGKYDYTDVKLLNDNFSESDKKTFEAYAQGIYDADKQLARLYEYIKNYDEPTILIFLGDHLPYMYTKSGLNILLYLDYFNDEDLLKNYYRIYNTQGLILSNFEMKEKGKEKVLSCNFLLNYVLNNMDIELSDYYKWLYTTNDILPASNSIVSQDSEGNLYWTSELKGEMKEVYDLQEKFQYQVLK